MTYDASSSPNPSPPPRPSTVTIAAYLQFALLALSVISAIITFVTSPALIDAVSQASAEHLSPSEASTITTTMQFAVYGGVTIGLIPGVLLAVFGAIHMRGKNWARIATWVLAGLGACCGAISLPFTGAQTNIEGVEPGAAKALEDAVASAQPSWVTPVSMVLMIVSLVAYVAVIILLALPASNNFFRKPKPDPMQGFPPQGPPPQGPPPQGPPPQGFPPQGPPPQA
ncbi:MAG TPA: hypothetical protein H9902_10100 [Candidatus Stackebrandtia faecavium]|nr:hypothetical protein [Candidatus Stackebrandtia faecavium]